MGRESLKDIRKEEREREDNNVDHRSHKTGKGFFQKERGLLCPGLLRGEKIEGLGNDFCSWGRDGMEPRLGGARWSSSQQTLPNHSRCTRCTCTGRTRMQGDVVARQTREVMFCSWRGLSH